MPMTPYALRIASWTITCYQSALGLADFLTSNVFGLDVGFPMRSDWNYPVPNV